MEQVRLDRCLASTGRWSRKEAKELLRQGRVSVNGQTQRDGGVKVDPAGDDIAVNGEKLTLTQYTYVMLHKPAGVLSATEDRSQRTVLDLLPQELRRRGLFPVGRLDKDTEGLLLLTDHGALAHALLHPKRHVAKTYLVQVDGALDEADKAALQAGLILGDGLHCLPARLELTERPDWGRLTIMEGKFHQVKRMMAARGKPVVYLKRLTMGPLTLDAALGPGEYRLLEENEVKSLLELL